MSEGCIKTTNQTLNDWENATKIAYENLSRSLYPIQINQKLIPRILSSCLYFFDKHGLNNKKSYNQLRLFGMIKSTTLSTLDMDVSQVDLLPCG